MFWHIWTENLEECQAILETKLVQELSELRANHITTIQLSFSNMGCF